MAKSKINIQPLGDRVLIKEREEDDSERTTDAGIIIPETVSNDSGGAKRGTVVAVGPGARDEDGERQPIDLSEGDDVLFSWGEKVTIDGQDFHLVSEGNVLGVVQ